MRQGLFQHPAKYPCDRVLGLLFIGEILNEYDKRISKEPITWKELVKKMSIVFYHCDNPIQDVIRGALEVGYREFYADDSPKFRSTPHPFPKWSTRGKKRPNLIVLPTREQVQEMTGSAEVGAQ